MIRYTPSIIVALCMSASPLYAQSTVFKVSTPSANVHQSPSTGSPVIGTAARGAVVEVIRELGSWVRVKWPIAKDGIGYIHVSTGSIARGAAATPTRAAAEPPAARPAPSPATPPPAARTEAVPPPPRGEYMFTPAHTFAVGGLVGGPGLGIGASARAWPHERVGFQMELSREAHGDAPARVTSMQLAPSLMFALPDRVTDYMWLRPYVGAGPTFQRQTLDIVSESRLGFQGFGGAEVTLPSVQQLALSADVRYHWFDAPLLAVENSGIGVSVSAHWYFK
jgi:hypothetical protein